MLAFLLPVLPLRAQTPAKTDNEKKSESAEKKPETPPEKHFADVVKDAKVVKGLFILYKTEDKVFLEILPDQFDKMYMLSLTCESGLGEGGFYGAEMCGETAVSFHRQDKNVQLLARNTRFGAQPNSPMERAVKRSLSDSILGSAKIESLPHPERKSLLIDLGALLLTDLPMMGYALEESFRIPYRFDPKNSSFGLLKSFERNIEIETIAHYATDHPPLPPLIPPPTPPLPRILPVVRRLLVHFRYSFFELPPPGFAPRFADDRVGHSPNQVQ